MSLKRMQHDSTECQNADELVKINSLSKSADELLKIKEIT
jgi:hypothetical protein